jgi:hypothetical protein
MEIRRKEIASTEVANTVTLCKCHSDVTRGCLSIAVNTFGTDDGIERFESFRCEKHGCSKATYMFRQVEYNVEFGFVEPCAGPTGSRKKKIPDFSLQGVLKHFIRKLL